MSGDRESAREVDMNAFTNDEVEFLVANELARERWLYSQNAAPILSELCDRGLMQPAFGEFGAPIDKGETANLFERKVPIVELTSLYMMTTYGRDQWRIVKSDQP